MLLFSEFLENEKHVKLHEGAAEKINEIQMGGGLETLILLIGKPWLTAYFLEYCQLP